MRAHTALVVAIQTAARSLGFAVSRAQAIPNAEDEHRVRMADLEIGDSCGSNFSATNIDVSVRDYMKAGGHRVNLDGTLTIRPHFVSAEVDKNKRYKQAYADMGRNFIPFVVSSSGALSGTDGMAKTVINTLATRYAALQCVKLSVAINVVSDFISSSVTRQLCLNSEVAQRKVLHAERRLRDAAHQAQLVGVVPPAVIYQGQFGPVPPAVIFQGQLGPVPAIIGPNPA